MLAILYQDDDIIAIDKPAGLASIPERDKTRDSVLTQLRAKYSHRIFVVHRLDKYASGAIIFAKNSRAHRHLCGQFAERTVKKSYLALTHGVVEESHGIIDKPIRRFGSGRVAVDYDTGKGSATEFEVVRRFSEHTLLRANPATGRQHQIRVHLYSIGHPIVGDLLYGQRFSAINCGREQKTQKNLGAKHFDLRLLLHAERITFTLPAGGNLTVEAPLPDDFKKFIQNI